MTVTGPADRAPVLKRRNGAELIEFPERNRNIRMRPPQVGLGMGAAKRLSAARSRPFVSDHQLQNFPFDEQEDQPVPRSLDRGDENMLF